MGGELDIIAGQADPVKTIEELYGIGTSCRRKITLWRVPEGRNLLIIHASDILGPCIGILCFEGNTCSWSQPAGLLVELDEAIDLVGPVVSGSKAGNKSRNEELHLDVLERQNFNYNSNSIQKQP